MNPEAKVPVSAYLITFNNARSVEQALQSLTWADEIVVVDSFSTDATPEIARRYATRFEQRAWPGFRDQYQYAAGLCRHDWQIFVDADEVVPPELAAEIQEELRRNAARPEPEQVRGYYGHRRTYYLGRWILHGGWVPDFEIRLCHRGHARWAGDLHAKIHVDGKVAHLGHFYQHYTYANIAEQLATIDNYSGTAAADMDRNGRRFSLFICWGTRRRGFSATTF